MGKKSSIYIYPAIFRKEEEGYTVTFIDFCWCTEGKTLEKAIANAEEVLCEYISSLNLSKAVNVPKSNSQLKHYILKDNEFISLIKIDIINYLKLTNKKSVRKNLTIPAWLNTLAEDNNLNFSQILKEALKKELSID